MREAVIYLSFIGVFVGLIAGFEIYRSHAFKPPASFELSKDDARSKVFQ